MTFSSAVQPRILMYHRVAECLTDPWGLCVSPQHFGEHLQVLRTHANVVSLADWVYESEAGKGKQAAIAITFDDGYLDNLIAAAPLLDRHDAPATVFIATGYMGHTRGFWWDALERVFLGPWERPAILEFEIAGTIHRVDLGGESLETAVEMPRHRAWRAYASEPPTVRHAAFLATWERLVGLPDAQIWICIDAMMAATGVPATDPGDNRSLSFDEVRILALSRLVDIGAHTVTHPALPLLPPESQIGEISDSKASLEALLDRPIAGFSYPHGRYDEHTVRYVRDAGYRFACAATPGPHTGSDTDSRFLLPRLIVPDCDGDAFIQMLARESDV